MNRQKTIKPLVILLAEDSPTDVMLTREALVESKLSITLHVVENGVDAMDFLHRQGAYVDAPRPDLVLLDINMPRKSGLEAIAEIKSDESLRTIPVVILTTSNAEADIMKAYGYHANCYITKPVDYEAFAQVVRDTSSFWLNVATLPRD